MLNGPGRKIREGRHLVEMGQWWVYPYRAEEQTGDVAVACTHQGGQAELDKTEGCLSNAVSCYWLTGSLDWNA